MVLGMQAGWPVGSVRLSLGRWVQGIQRSWQQGAGPNNSLLKCPGPLPAGAFPGVGGLNAGLGSSLVVGQPEPQRGAGLVERIVSKVPHSMHVLTLIRAAGLA